MMKRVLVVLGYAVMAITVALADVCVWHGGSSSDWFDADNWSDGVPVAGQSVVVGSGAEVVLAASTPVMGSVTISGGTVTLANWETRLQALEITVGSGGRLAVAGPFEEGAMSNRVYLVCSNLTVAVGGMIDAVAGGYLGGPPGSNRGGQGPGKTNGGGVYSGGAGHGGRGGWNYPNMGQSGGASYGDKVWPITPGSSAGTRNENYAYGGHGGGVVTIEATGDVVVDGVVDASGGDGNYFCGGGAGGSVAISCRRLGGDGKISANGGGYTGTAGAGGGGRIAVHYEAVIGAPGIRFEVKNGGSLQDRHLPDPMRWENYWCAELGTIYLSDTTLVKSPLNNFYGCLSVPGFARWQSGDLVVGSAAYLVLDAGFQLEVNGVLSVLAGGVLELGHEGTLEVLGDVRLDGGELIMNVMTQMTCRSDLVITNGGALYLFSAPTLDTSFYGGTLDVSGEISVGAGSWLYPDANLTNGGVVRIRAQRLTVAAGGGINSDLRGFGGPGSWRGTGYGPGGGIRNTWGTGGGYGGRGGAAYYQKWMAGGGEVYGNPLAPVLPGSGGGTQGSGRAGHGGGSIWLEIVEKVELEGSLSANGGNSKVSASGGGAGGGIFIATKELISSIGALMQANGGNGHYYSYPNNSGGSGGGGRIAVALGLSESQLALLVTNGVVKGLYSYDCPATYLGGIEVEPGRGTPDYIGVESEYASEAGTIAFSSPNVVFNVVGSPGRRGVPQPAGYGLHYQIAPGTLLTNSVMSPVDMVAGQRWLCQGWELRDAAGSMVAAGVEHETVFRLDEARRLTWNWTNEFELAVDTMDIEMGSVSQGQNGWYLQGSVVAGLQATAAEGYQFSEWLGDIDEGSKKNNPLSVTMDRARTLTALFVSTSGTIRYWHGEGEWETNGNWEPEGMPGPYDHAVISSGTVNLRLPREAYQVTVSNGARLVFHNWNTTLTATNLTVKGGGVITLPAPFDEGEASNRVMIVCHDLTVEAGAKIDVAGMGFMGGPPGGDRDGAGPGKTDGRDAYSAGAGHGGRGGWNYSYMNKSGGATYGNAAWPVTPGSSAGTRNESYAYGGHGGGVVTVIATGDVIIDGVIDASGGDGYYYCGGGSGGSVAISCRRLGGSGRVSANGGDFTNIAGAGGGGRIALLYDEVIGIPDFTIEAKVFNTISPHTGNLLRWDRYWLAEAGTIYLADELLVTGQNAVIYGAVVIPGFARWEAESIKLGSGSNIVLPVDFELSVEGMLELEAGSSLELADGGRLSCGSLSVDGGSLVLHSFTQMVCRADLAVSSGGSLYLYSAPSDGLQAYGAVVEVGGKVITEEGAWIYPDANITNGAPVRFTAERYMVKSGSGFNASGRGYGGPGSWSGSGSGPGAGVRNNYGTGAGHGGAGGAAYYQKWLDGGGETYGNPLAPVLPGSGGGTQSSGIAGHGGGVIWLEARQEIALSGSLLADGNGAVASVSGGGSGGGILIAAPRIAALSGAVISARGGNGIGSSAIACGGAAGGGRVALAHNVAPSRLAALIAGESVWVKEVDYLPTVAVVPDVSQGTTNNDYAGAPEYAPQPGTVRFYRGGEGTVLLVR